MMAGSALMTWYTSGQKVRLDPQFHRWGPLLKDARYFFAANFSNVLLLQGDYLVTGLFFDQTVLGAYYFAFRMSSQTGQLISTALATILTPSFARLDKERDRQIAAYERTCAALLFLGIPTCCLQALVAIPLSNLIFSKDWMAAAPLFQTLSLTLGFAVPMSTSMSLLIAQGRLRPTMLLTILQAMAFVSFVFCGALCGSIEWVARFVAFYFLIFGTITVVIPVVGKTPNIARFVWRLYWFPTFAGAATLVAGWAVTRILPFQNSWIVMGFEGGTWLLVFVFLIWFVKPAASQEVLPRMASLIHRVIDRLRHPL